MENIAHSRLGLHADQRRLFGTYHSFDQRDMILLIQRVFENKDPEIAECGGKLCRRNFVHKRLGLQAESNKISHCDHLQPVSTRHLRQLRDPSHGSILVHHFANHPGRV